MSNENTSPASGDSSDIQAELEVTREKISNVDEKILQALHERRELSTSIIRSKDRAGSSIRDEQREDEVLASMIQAGKSLGLESHYVTRVFQEIISDSIRLQRQYLQERANTEDANLQVKRVAFQGVEGAYSFLAAQKYFSREGDRTRFQECQTFKGAMQAVEKGQADYAVLPIENTTSGGINDVYDLLLHTQLAVVGEEKFKVEHCLLGVEGAELDGIKKIYCHPQTVLQCSQFLADKDLHIEYLSDSVLTGKRLQEENDPSVAAIASSEAARIFGLTVLKEKIANQVENYTRFLIVARKPIKVDPRIPCKTSIVMSTAQEPGSLVDALQIFREHNINLTKLESRPLVDNPWEEMFYLDIEGNIEDERVSRALDEVTKRARFYKVLGCYPTGDVSIRELRPEQVLGVNGNGSTASEKESFLAKKVVNETNKPPTPKKSKGYKLASRDHKKEDTVIEVGGVKIGGDNFTVIAGPCSVESYDQIMECAKHAKDCGAQILRGGCFKPRTSPYSFQGLGWEGLDIMAEAGKKYGLPIITEVLSPDDVERVAEKADLLQIGARNMQNFTLLSEAGRTQRPVLLKRGMSASIEDVLHAAEYVLAQGNLQVIFCERGIRTFETATRNTLDLSAVPVLKQKSHLPVIVDPSHAAGERWLVPPLSYGAKAVGAHGIIVEFHPKPEEAMSDGPQALLFPQFREMMENLLG